MEEAILEHTASTDSLLSTFGHGSLPKLLFDMATEHLSLPMHFCNKSQIKDIMRFIW